MELTATFVALLQQFRGVFTQPSFQTFVALLTGWALSHRHRYVTELIQSSGSTHRGHHSRYHRFFSHARWSLDALCLVLARFLVTVFVPRGLIELAVDDTLCRKRGLTVYGTGMHHDPLISSRAKALVSWGHDWVIFSLVVRCPWWSPTKVWSLPVLFRLYRNRQGLTKGRKGHKPPPDPNHRTRPQLALEMIQLFAAWFPDRELLVTGDSA
ncbi:MAG: transposase [Planctomycetes bacterium]|nr:transposase [Planctomycetota bacterium]